MNDDARCRCGRLLFRVVPGTNGQVEVKCSRCKVLSLLTFGSTVLMSTA